MKKNTEKWKSVKGFEGIYEVSSTGRIKTLNYRKSGAERIRKIKKPGQNGYFKLILCKNNKRYHFSVHRLVAIAFVDNPSNKPVVNHIDGNKLNNNYKNLEWVTKKENDEHAIKTGLRDNVAEKHGMSKLRNIQVLAIRNLIKSGMRQNKIAKIFNISPGAVNHIKKQRQWRSI